MEVLVKMSIQNKKLYSIVEIAKELKLSESRIRAYLGKAGSPEPVTLGQFYGGGRTPNLYDLEEFKRFYLKTVNSRQDKIQVRDAFNNELAKNFLRGRR